MLNKTWLCRYPHPREVVCDNGSEFKRDFTPLLKEFTITLLCTSINNSQSNTTVERIHQFIYNKIVIKDIDRKVYDYINPWRETQASVLWEIRASYNHTLGFIPGQAVFGGDMLFNLMSIVDWYIVTSRNKRQVDIDDVCKNARRVSHDFTTGDLFYVENTEIYCKLDYNKQGPYVINEVSTNCNV